MTNRFDEVAQLKALPGRREAIIKREQDPRSPNYCILERSHLPTNELAGMPPRLGAQVAALKKIAEDERAYILSANVVESTGVDEFLRTEARRQLTEKYPEAFK